MPTTDACRRLFAHANVAGRLGDAWCAPGPWLRAAERRVGRPFAGLLAAQNLGGEHVAALQQVYGPRMARPIGAQTLYQVHVASALQKARLLLPTPAAGEWLFGRGHTGSLGPALSGDAGMSRLLRGYDCCSRTGLLGILAETLPMRAASALEGRGYHLAAVSCLVGAICGRVTLQPCRLLCAAVVLGLALPYAAVTLVSTCMGDVIFTNIRRLAAVQPNTNPNVLFFILGIGVACIVLSRVYGPGTIVLQPAPAPAPEVADPPRAGAVLANNPHEQINRFMRRAIEQFGDKLVDSDEAATRTANRIVQDLKEYCVGTGDDAAFRGGLCTLQNFMDLTYDEAQWRPTPDYEVERYMAEAMAQLRASGVDAARAHALACTVAHNLRHNFAGEASPKPTQAGLNILATFMHEHFPKSGWRA